MSVPNRTVDSVRYPFGVDAAPAAWPRNPTTAEHVVQMIKQVLLTARASGSTGPTSLRPATNGLCAELRRLRATPAVMSSSHLNVAGQRAHR